MLQSLRLYVHPYYEDGEDRIFPNMTFPYLQSLAYMRGSCFPTEGILLRRWHASLRHLEILNPWIPPPLGRLLAALTPLQNLEELILHNACIYDGTIAAGTSTSQSQHFVALPHLRVFEVIDYTGDGIYILHGVAHPATTLIRMSLYGSWSWRNDPASSLVFSQLRGDRVLGTPPTVQSISVLKRKYWETHITLWEQQQSLDEIMHKRHTAESAFFQLSCIDTALVSAVLGHTALLEVRTAVLAEGVDNREPLPWLRIVAQMPALEELGLQCVCYNDMRGTSTEVQGLQDDPRIDENSDSFFPQLKVLRVHEFHHKHPITLGHNRLLQPLAIHLPEYRRLAQKLMSLQKIEHLPFSKLDILVQRSPIPVCTICDGYPPSANIFAVASEEDTQSVPGCSPCCLISSRASRVLKLLTGERN